jgi:hypothetical protein
MPSTVIEDGYTDIQSAYSSIRWLESGEADRNIGYKSARPIHQTQDGSSGSAEELSLFSSLTGINLFECINPVK